MLMFFRRGGGSANFIFMGVGIFPMKLHFVMFDRFCIHGITREIRRFCKNVSFRDLLGKKQILCQMVVATKGVATIAIAVSEVW